ncbi:hypothetical protein [Paenibacillus sp. FJAT-27812]|uniref:hypothetical protein n=1 Tax=Paenibacillus sp. FJAT-27812 TaxID=1684143 RepID=UPI0006A7CCE2|nr:hypothetical protein [Paenibacillus sp. FJAT-27812]
MAAASSFVIFPDGGWNSLPAPFQQLFSKLSDKYAIYIVSESPVPAQAPPEVTSLSLKQAEQFNWEQAAAVVLHPCWIQTAMAAKPLMLIAMPESPQQGEPALWTKCRKWLCAHADLIITESETYYLEQSFCTEHVFLLDGRDEVCDLLAKQAFNWMLSGFSPKPLIRLQQRSLAEWYSKLLSAGAGQPETSRLQPLFFHAVYRYLICDLERAKEALLASFELAVMEGKEDALSTYYRFLSAIELKQGLTKQAVQTYSFTAVTEEEKQTVSYLDDWLHQGKDGLAGALLYRLNDDFKQSLERLELIEAEPMAERLATESCIQSGRLMKAIALLSPEHLTTDEERQQYLLLRGTTFLLEGKRHEAIHAFLEAAENGLEALGNIAELAVLDASVLELANDVSRRASDI